MLHSDMPGILRCMQDIDVAVIKATTAQYHVVPKEKHVRSARPAPLPAVLHLHANVDSRQTPRPCSVWYGNGLTQSMGCAALKGAVHVSRSRQDVAHVKLELLKRLRKATDWLVRGGVACMLPCMLALQALPRSSPAHASRA